MKSGSSASRYIGISALVCVVLFFLLLPFYLGPDDLALCDEKPDNTSLRDSCHKADAVVTLSGGDTTARTSEAIKLYKNGWADKLIFSGAAQDKSGPSNASSMQAQARFQGVPARDILLEEAAVNTQENASKSRALIESNGLGRIILVTSAYHQQRANLEFKKYSGAKEVINHPVLYDRQWRKNWFLTPSGWWLAIGETIKIVSFYATGN